MSTSSIRNDMNMSSSQGKRDIYAFAVNADREYATTEEISGVDEDLFTEGDSGVI